MNENEAQEHRIDLTFMEDNASGEKVRWIIDYKLTALDESDDLKLASQTHTLQLARYAALFTYENLPIKQAVFFMHAGQLELLE